MSKRYMILTKAEINYEYEVDADSEEEAREKWDNHEEEHIETWYPEKDQEVIIELEELDEPYSKNNCWHIFLDMLTSTREEKNMATWSKKISFNPATDLEPEVWAKILDKFIFMAKENGDISTCQMTDFACIALLLDKADEMDNQSYSQGELYE